MRNRIHNLPKGVHLSGSPLMPFKACYRGKHLGVFKTPLDAESAVRREDEAYLLLHPRKPAKRKQMPFRPRSAANAGSDVETWFCHNLSNKRAECRRKSREFDLDLEYVMDLWHSSGGRCALSGLSMVVQPKGSGHNPMSLSIDRIDSSVGYVKGNIQLVCLFANLMKGTMSQHSFIMACTSISSHAGHDYLQVEGLLSVP